MPLSHQCSGLKLRGLRQVQIQHAVLELCPHFCHLARIEKRKALEKSSIEPFEAMDSSPVVFRLLLLLTLEEEHSIVDGHRRITVCSPPALPP